MSQSMMMTSCFCLQSLKSSFIYHSYSWLSYSIRPSIFFRFFTFTLSLYDSDFTMVFISYISLRASYRILVFYSKYLSPFIGVKRPVEKSAVFGNYLGRFILREGCRMSWLLFELVDCWL